MAAYLLIAAGLAIIVGGRYQSRRFASLNAYDGGTLAGLAAALLWYFAAGVLARGTALP